MPRISENVIKTDRTLAVEVGDGAWMDLPISDWLWQLRYADEPERGTQCSDRLLAAGLLESYLYLVEECTKEEAWRRIKIMRGALKLQASRIRMDRESDMEQDVPMTILEDAAYRAALKRTVEAKWRMDRLQAEFEKAEDEWHRATIALDELENA